MKALTQEERVRAALDQIEDVLLGLDVWTAAQVWAVISALRGPDVYEDCHLKGGTTGIIRSKAFPRYGYSQGLVVNPKDNEIDRTALNQSKSFHFMGHITEAAAALEIPIVTK